MLQLIREVPIQTEESLKAFRTSNGTAKTDTKYSIEIDWLISFGLIAAHVGALIGIYLCFRSAMWQTILFAIFVFTWSLIGKTAGSHRLWTHRAYKAKLPLRIFLAFWISVALQKSIYEWVWNHRMHHTHSETNADPHNATRGFFYSHVGWLMVKKHPEFVKEAEKLDLRDLQADPVVRFQHRYYVPLATFCCFVLPTVIPMLLWGESIYNSFYIAGVLRAVLAMHYLFMVNSVAHMFGNRPYDRNIYPRESLLVKLVPIGEGFHNYHHTFPWDYEISEFGFRFNMGTAFINFMAWLGLAYDLRKATPQAISNRKLKTGDGSHHFIEAASESRHLL